MTQLTHAALSGLETLLEQGKHRAKAQCQPILVSLTQRLPFRIDPLSVFSAAESIADSRYLWWRPADAFWFVGTGEASRLTANGPERFSHLRGIWEKMLETAILESADSLAPRAYLPAGFRFDIDSPVAGHWRDFPGGLLAVPEWTVSSQGGEAALTANALVLPDSDAQFLGRRLRDRAVRLLGHDRIAARTLPLAQTNDKSGGLEKWRSDVRRSLDLIAQGRLAKIVLARSKDVVSSEQLPVEGVLERLSCDYPGCRVFAFGRQGTCFLGATPEELVKKAGSAVSSTCLAGSARRGRTKEEDQVLSRGLVTNDKERREHALVSDWVSGRLRTVCRNVSADPVPQVVKLGNVQHLATTFSGEIDPKRNVLELVGMLHPTPAVAGMPVEAALQAINQIERFDRGWYGGPVGWVQANDGEFGVALRCALLRGKVASLYAGAGIVSGSDPLAEYRETAIKLEPLMAALGAI